MPRPLSPSRRHRALALTSRATNWRPRVSSPLTSEVTFTGHAEKCFIMPDMADPAAEEPMAPRRAGALQIGFSLVVDCLMSLWLCRIAMDNLFTLRSLFSAIPAPFNQPGTILFCNSNNYYLSPSDYPVLNSIEPLSALQTLPSHCVYLPRLIVSAGQSEFVAGLTPFFIACFITLKLAFGYLLLRTSKTPTAPSAYLKYTAAFHLLVSYTAFVYIHVHIDLILHRYPHLEQALRVSSECIFFLAGVTVCLCSLSIVVFPLLWVCSKYNHASDLTLPTVNGNQMITGEANFNHHHQTGGYLSAISKQKKRALLSRF